MAVAIGFSKRLLTVRPALLGICNRRCLKSLSTLTAAHRLRIWQEIQSGSNGHSSELAHADLPQNSAAPTNASKKASVDESTLRHSAAHLLGWALEEHYGDDCLLTDGPATENGFFYDALVLAPETGKPLVQDRIDRIGAAGNNLLDADCIRADADALAAAGGAQYPTDADLAALSNLVEALAARKVPFERLAVSRTDAARMFAYSPFKLAALAKIPQDDAVTVFRCGDFIDLCRGPHVRNSAAVRAVRLTGSSAAQWAAGRGPHALARVHGVAFADRSHAREWERRMEEARRRDHRLVGQQQDLFMFSPLSAGAPFFLPHGTRVVQRLLDYLRAEYRSRSFEEVVTPLVFGRSLWEQSGHWQNYSRDLVAVSDSKTENDSENNQQALKPMNCPGHCIMFDSAVRSYRNLPMRLAEFSPLHRNEASGALSGLTRVRKFHQDDGHIFCTSEQVSDEIKSALEFVDATYARFQFPSYELALSTRPESGFVGEIAQWDAAEAALRSALDATGRSWTIKHGDGAFYGPKIDISVRDALGRQHQTATIQLDFQLPQRFKLRYQTADGAFATPVVIHRAVLGSIERMLAILIEHFGGKWPFWLSPRQAAVVPVRADLLDYARIVQKEIAHGAADGSTAVPAPWFYIDVDESDHTLNKRIRDAQSAQYNYILVVGDRERDARTVSVRTRSGEQIGVMPLADVRSMFVAETAAFR